MSILETTRPRVRPTRAQRQLMRVFLTHVEVLSAAMRPGLNRLWAAMGDDAAQVHAGLIKGRKAALEPSPADEAIAQADADRVVRGMDWHKHEGELAIMFERQHIRVITSTVETINGVFDLGVNLPDWKAREIVAAGGKRLGLVDLQADAKLSLFRSILDGRMLGEGQDALARRIRSEVPAGRFVNAGPAYRSKLISRTETKWAQNVSAMSAYGTAGATFVLAFDAQGRGDSDPDCEARNGLTYRIGPEADAELASEHPNGTLSFAPVFEPDTTT